MVFFTVASYAMPTSWRPLIPGKPTFTHSAQTYTVQNNALQATYRQGHGGGLDILGFKDLYTGQDLAINAPVFTLTLADGTTLSSAQMVLSQPPTSYKVRGNRRALKKAHQKDGQGLQCQFTNAQYGLTISLKAFVRTNEDYIREVLTFSTSRQSVPISEINFGGFTDSSAKVVGTTLGSPIVDHDVFWGVEHPMSVQAVDPNGVVEAAMLRKLPIAANSSVTYSFVLGAAPKTQLRRCFANYVEEERARPYKPFLHYNSWYDLGYFNTYTADQCVNRINTFGQELVAKRHVKLSSFLFDDGWDNHHSVWKFGKGFPDGFTPLTKAAEKYGANPGVWLSPWGGYGPPREKRLAFGKTQGMEEDSQGYALSGPKYFKRFLFVTSRFVNKYKVNQFKFDGTGSPDKKYPGSQFDSDFDAAITLIKDLRKDNRNLFINLTTGTWPSPFWLKYADSTWRGGEDHAFAGVGTNREQWMTYRDGDTYHGVVERGPLYPINSLMLHGIIYARYTNRLHDDPGNDFRKDVRTYFANGTQLQEMYITPKLLTTQNWNDLAESAKWSYRNQKILRDNHWVGGDPLKLEVYGWAAWSSSKSILSLRNPSNHPQAFSVDIAKLLELPPGDVKSFTVTAAYKDETGFPHRFEVGTSKVITLQPFQILVMELHPETQP